jgi:acetyl esterase/lipase
MFLVFFALDSPGQKQSGKNKTKRKCTVRLIKTGNTCTSRGALGLALVVAVASSSLDSSFYGDAANLRNAVATNTTSQQIPLWPAGQVPGEHAGAIGPETMNCLTKGVNVSECHDRGIHDVTVPTITPFLVAGADSAVIVSPGGGYGFLAVDREGNDIAAWLNSIGVSAFVLKYRVPGRTWLPFGAAPLMDAQRAMGLVRQMAESGKMPGLNKAKIGFMGFSAGAHLTGHLGVAWQKRTYPRVDAADDEACRPDFSMMVYPWRSVSEAPVNETVPGASASNVTKDTPPTMLVQAEDDPVHVENSLYYYLALKQKAAAPSEMHLYPAGGHGYGRCTVNLVAKANWQEVCTWPDRGALFLQTLGAAPKPNKTNTASAH